MSKVSITKEKLDTLANSISEKSGVDTPLSLDEMKEAVDEIKTISEINLEDKNIMPTEQETVIEADVGYDGLGTVTVGGIDSEYIGSDVPRKTSSDLTVDGNTVNVPGGYYENAASKAISSGSATTPATTITVTPTISINSSTGVITASVSDSESITPTVSAGYVSSGTAGTVTVSGSNTSNLSTQAGKTVSPTELEQTAVAAGKYTIGAVKVGAISDSYVGSGITRRDSRDLTASGDTVSVPSGFYENSASKAVAAGTEGTPTATKSAVTNHTISITPSVTNSAGYIAGGTKTGNPVTVSASELVSGSQTITTDNTYDVTGLAEIVVDVPTGTARTSADLTASGPTVTVPAGLYSQQASKSVASGSVTMPASIDGGNTSISISSGKITLSKSVSATPSVTTAGYVSSGTAGNTTISLSATADSVGATTYTPTTSQQTIINAGTYVYGTQKIDAMPTGTAGTPTATKGAVSNHSVSVTPSVANTTGYITGGTKTGTAVSVTAAELVSGTKSITANGTGIDVTNYAAVDVSVSGGGDPTFLVTVSYNSQTDMWEPDQIFSDISTAYYDGKNLALEYANPSGTPDDVQHGLSYVYLEDVPDLGDCFYYGVSDLDYSTLTEIWTYYIYHTNGLDIDGNNFLMVKNFETVTKTYTPTTSQQTDTVTFDSTNYNGLQQVNVTVDAMPTQTLPTTTSGSATAGYTSKATVSRSTSDQYINIPTGYNAAGAYYKVNAVANGSATPAASISATGATVSTGTNTLTLSKSSVSNTPQVTAGYISSGTAGNSSVSLTASVTTQAAQTIYPSTSDQTINSGRYLTGNQTIKAVAVSSNLTADNIKNGVTITIGDSADADRIKSVTGTYTGGGGSSMNVQIAQSTSRASSSSYTNLCSLTCATAGTYDVYWTNFRSSTSGTWGSQLYLGDTAYGNVQNTFTNHIQNVHLTGVQIAKNQTVAVYARSRGSNYYAYVSNLVIKQTA